MDHSLHPSLSLCARAHPSSSLAAWFSGGLGVLLCPLRIGRVVFPCVNSLQACGNGWVLEYLRFRVHIYFSWGFINLSQRKHDTWNVVCMILTEGQALDMLGLLSPLVFPSGTIYDSLGSLSNNQEHCSIHATAYLRKHANIQYISGGFSTNMTTSKKLNLILNSRVQRVLIFVGN